MSWLNYFIMFLHSCFGLWFAYKMYVSQDQKIFSSFVIKSCVFSYLALLLCATQWGAFYFILSIYIPILLFISTEYALTYKNLKIFQDQFLILLDSIIARMKMGLGFRESLELSIEQINAPWIQESLKEIQDRMIFAQSIDSLPQSFRSAFSILEKAHRDSHHPLKRLQYARDNLKIELLFQAKAGQALLQTRVQSLVIGILYLATLIFTVSYTGAKFLNLILLSSFLFILGSVWVFSVGRKIKWTL